MKQLAFMVFWTLFGIGGTFLIGPHVGVIVYYMFAVLRPQFLWEWALSPYGVQDANWSFYVAVATIAGALLVKSGVLRTPGSGPSPGQPAPRLTVPHFLLWAFAVWVTLSFVFARDKAYAQPYYVECLKIFVMFTVAAWTLQRLSQLWWLLVVVALADIYVAYEVNFHYFVNHYMFLTQQGYGGWDNNGAALMFAMGIPLCYFLWESTPGKFRWAYLAGIAFLGHAILLSFSRGAMVSLIPAAGLLWVFSRRKVAVTGVLVLAAIGAVATAGPEVRARFFSISQSDADESAQSRLTTWKIAIQMANEEPILGFGVRNSNLYTHAYGADIEKRSIHSQYLQTAADCGWVGMGLFLALMGASAWSGWAARRSVRGRDDPEAVRVRAMGSAILCSLAVYAVGAAFLSLETFELAYIFFLVAAQLHGLRRAAAAQPAGWVFVPAAPPPAEVTVGPVSRKPAPPPRNVRGLPPMTP